MRHKGLYAIWISLLFPVYKLDRESIQPINMCDIILEKAKVRGGTINRWVIKQKLPFKEFF